MAMRQVIHITLLYLLSHIFIGVVSERCIKGGSGESIYGWKLQGHIYKTMKANFGYECLLICRQDNRCQSFNWVISVNMCEFSDRTKEARSEDFVPDPDRYYYRRDMNRAPLGSFPELPAETCKEIKASEGEAASQKYWLSIIIPGFPVLAYCDMETEDIDECSAIPSVCDVNANCQNKVGSYLCTCKPGFVGDGKTCSRVQIVASCSDMKRIDNDVTDGTYNLTSLAWKISVYCDMTSSGYGWTLIARFSNNDTKRWMNDTGFWWYDRNSSFGITTDSSHNADMISPAFWLVRGNELKITRSDDHQHVALLQTTGNCLGGQTFRSKITTYGNFRKAASLGK
ncbi:hypothetical protein ABFA07_015548 [Porites harrisoni]